MVEGEDQEETKDEDCGQRARRLATLSVCARPSHVYLSLVYYCLRHVAYQELLVGSRKAKSAIPSHSPGVVRCTTCLGFFCWHLWYCLW